MKVTVLSVETQAPDVLRLLGEGGLLDLMAYVLFGFTSGFGPWNTQFCWCELAAGVG